MKYFNVKEINSLEELKKEYKKLVKQFHPDLNREKDTTQDMKQINAEYEILFDQLSKKESHGETINTETAQDLINIIDALINLQGLEIEIIGSWLWVTGETYPIKETLKELGFKFSGKRKAWYFTKEQKKKRGSKLTMDEIRDIYGSEKVSSKGTNKKEIV